MALQRAVRILAHGLRAAWVRKGIGALVVATTAVSSAGLGLALAVEKALARQVAKALEGFGRGGIQVQSAERRGRRSSWNWEDVTALSEALSGQAVVGVYRFLGQRPLRGERALEAPVYGVTPGAAKVLFLQIGAGEGLGEEDFQKNSLVCVVGSSVAEAAFTSSPLGKRLVIDGVPFLVKGVFRRRGADELGEDLDFFVHVPLGAAVQRLGAELRFYGFRLRALREDEVQKVAEKVASVLRARHKLAPGEEDDFRLLTGVEVEKRTKAALVNTRRIGWLLSVLAWLTAGAAAALSFQAFCRSRSHEQALARALGAGKWDVALDFTGSMAALALLGGLGGAVSVLTLPWERLSFFQKLDMQLGLWEALGGALLTLAVVVSALGFSWSRVTGQGGSGLGACTAGG